MTNPNLAAALEYGKRGWPVFPIHTPGKDGLCTCGVVPCPDAGKHPRTTNGFKDASGDPETIRRWWSQWHNANIGVCTGRAAGIWVLDIDPRHGGDVSFQNLIEQHGPIHPTRSHKTGGGGMHYIFSTTDEDGKPVTVPNSTGEIAPGIDVKGEGGYIIVPPSLHASGGRYEVGAYLPVWNAPAWLLNMAMAPKTHRGGAGAQGERMTIPDTIPEGSRNATIYKMGCSLRSKGWTEGAIAAALHEENAAKCKPPLPAGEVDSIIVSVLQLPPGMSAPENAEGNGNAKKRGLTEKEITERVRDKLHVIAVSKTLFFYEDGIYKRNTGQIEKEIQDAIKDFNYPGRITELKREVKSYLTGIEWYEEPPFNKMEGYIPTRDCVLHLTDNGVEALPHDPKYLFTYKLGVKYDPGADTGPLLKVFNEWVDEDSVKYLIQLPAQAIAQTWGDCFKLAYLFEGSKNAGKTIYFNLLDLFISKENTCTIPLHTLIENRFAAAGLIGKLANIVDELPSVNLKNLDTFKSMVGGGPIRVERKGEDAYSTTPTAIHCFNCNVPPACSITDEESWWIRWLYTRFVSVFPVNPLWKREFLTDTNVSALLNLVLPALQEIRRTGDVHRQDPEDVKQIWLESSDILIKFISETCDRNPDTNIPKDVFYDTFLKFCADHKRAAISKTLVTQILGRHHIPVTRPLIHGKQTYSYHGLKWQEGKEPLTSDKGGKVGLADPGNSQISNFANYPHTLKCTQKIENEDKKSTVHDPKELKINQQTRQPENPQFSKNDYQDDHFQQLIGKYDLHPDLDVSGHTRFKKAGSHCSCKGCGSPGDWHDLNNTIRPAPLCDQHYQELKAAPGREQP